MLFGHSHYFRKMQPITIWGIFTTVTVPHKPPQSSRSEDLRFVIETELETDGRWIAEIPQVPGALAYGNTKEEAVNKAYAIALRSVADDVEHSREDPPNSISLERAIA
jgi:predicted RNase H-like HicB family nuclease